MILIYITISSEEEAKKIARHLLEEKLIACANIFPIQSMYNWKGKMADEKEIVVLGKTKAENYEKIVSEVEKIHSYDIPCILKIPMESNQKYEDWLSGEME